MRLAVVDAERGVLTPIHLTRISGAIQNLIEDLADHEDDQPSPAGTGETNDCLLYTSRCV